MLRTRIAVLLLLCGCASEPPDKRAAPVARNLTPTQEKCASQMYAERAVHPHSSVNWNIYDRCMQQAGQHP